MIYKSLYNLIKIIFIKIYKILHVDLYPMNNKLIFSIKNHRHFQIILNFTNTYYVPINEYR